MEKIYSDVLRIPEGYTEDVTNFACDVLQVSILRGECAATFDDDYFFEQLDTHITKNSLVIQQQFANRFLGEESWSSMLNYQSTSYLDFVNEFEIGSRSFIKEFLELNRATINVLASFPIWKIELKTLTTKKWLLKSFLNK